MRTFESFLTNVMPWPGYLVLPQKKHFSSRMLTRGCCAHSASQTKTKPPVHGVLTQRCADGCGVDSYAVVPRTGPSDAQTGGLRTRSASLGKGRCAEQAGLCALHQHPFFERFFF